MPGSWDPQVYRERAWQWRDAAAELPPGETRNAYLVLSEGYGKLADLIAKDVTGDFEDAKDPHTERTPVHFSAQCVEHWLDGTAPPRM